MEGDIQSIQEMKPLPTLIPPRTYEDLLAAIDKANGALSSAHMMEPRYSAWNDHLKSLLAMQERMFALSFSPAYQVPGISWSEADASR